ncbi:photosystem I subunit O-like [Gossypium australe]|uniref:Photosystem I subunit O-like n=1 Tax=Gossypium australe TaxID=47621 RepID=A0A5B6UQF4_9ROSI|nr:photosystem I subunit O-like [Gossypium australe]
MAATFSSPSTVVRLGSATSFSSPPNKTCLSSGTLFYFIMNMSECMISGFLKSSVRGRNPLRLAVACGRKFTYTPAINGKSLTGLLFDSIGTELAHFPTPPPITSQFWLWLVLWHLGLFITLTFGQIGFKGRTEDYF